jgi:hypothetical protein
MSFDIIRKVVSGDLVRYQDSEFNLNLTYITNNIIGPYSYHCDTRHTSPKTHRQRLAPDAGRAPTAIGIYTGVKLTLQSVKLTQRCHILHQVQSKALTEMTSKPSLSTSTPSIMINTWSSIYHKDLMIRWFSMGRCWKWDGQVRHLRFYYFCAIFCF